MISKALSERLLRVIFLSIIFQDSFYCPHFTEERLKGSERSSKYPKVTEQQVAEAEMAPVLSDSSTLLWLPPLISPQQHILLFEIETQMPFPIHSNSNHFPNYYSI